MPPLTLSNRTMISEEELMGWFLIYDLLSQSCLAECFSEFEMTE